MDRIMKQARREREQLVRLRRDFHRQPELALEEFRTARVIEAELDRMGVPHRRIGDTGVLGVVQGEKEGGGSVALRADIDALAIREETGAAYCSQVEGRMHACGHDAHTACLLGAAGLLARDRARFGGQIRLIFQSAEEIGGGALDFIRAGALEGVERVFGLHCAPDLPAGTVGVTPGLNNAAVDRFRIRIRGRSTHVSTPQLGADALYAASQLVVAIQGLVTRRTSPVEPVILGVGRLSAGSAYNIVAQSAELEGTTRTISQEMRLRVREWISQAARQTAALSGAEAEVIWEDICSALINHPQVSREVAALLPRLDSSVRIVTSRPLSLGGDNFSEFQREVPGCYAYLGTADPARPDTCNGLHNGRFDLDENVLPLGAALYAGYALWWLTEGRTGSGG